MVGNETHDLCTRTIALAAIWCERVVGAKMDRPPVEMDRAAQIVRGVRGELHSARAGTATVTGKTRGSSLNSGEA